MSNPSRILTENEIDTIVRNRSEEDDEKDVQVTDWNFSSVGKNAGLCGDHSILNINYYTCGNTRTLKCFIKYFPVIEDQKRWAIATRAFPKETFFFTNLARHYNNCIPRCYFSRKLELMVFENLQEKGFRTLNPRIPLDYDVVTIVLKSMARFHATSLIYEEKKSQELGRTYRLFDEFEEELISYMYSIEHSLTRRSLRSSIKGILKLIDYFQLNSVLRSGRDFKEVAAKVLENIANVVKPSSKYRNVINHGDLWATNIMIRYDKEKPTDCRFVDFQTIRYTPPIQDVLAFLHHTTRSDFRKKYTEELLVFYYKELEEQVANGGFDLNNLIPFREFLESRLIQENFGIVQAASYSIYTLLSSETLDELFEDDQFTQRVFYEDISLIAFRNLDKNIEYRNRLRERYVDLRDYCDLLSTP